ncbi:MAG: acetylhydrolase [Rhodovarius sp.]|nr:acetylhydrolase [Rhodovarius sp.]
MRRELWSDPDRGRDLPVLLRLPHGARPPHPLVLLSHGLGGSREGLAYLGEALAEAGMIALHLQHPGSDVALWGDPAALRAAAADPQVALARLQDGRFALDRALASLPADPLRIAAAGHSFGAWTVQHWLGQRGLPGLPLPPEPRIRAGIALSPVPPRRLSPAWAMAGVDRPLLHVTGSRDSSPLEETTPEQRTLLFRHTPDGVPAALLWLAGAGHMDFAGVGAVGAAFRPRIALAAVLFLRAVLQGDQQARGRLLAGLPGLLREGDRLETRALA